MELAEYENIFKNEGTHFYYIGTHNAVIKFLEVYLPQKTGNAILDAGCGTGALMKKLSRFGLVYGVDASHEALKFAQKNGLKKVKYGSVTNLPYKDNSFNAVISIDVLYHKQVENDLQALQEFNRVLKSGGILILKNPAHNWLRGNHDIIIHTKRRYTKEDLDKKLRKSGFQIIKSSYINIFFFPLALIKRLVESILKTKPSSDVGNLPLPINQLLINLYNIETNWFLTKNIPFGLSIFVVARKP